MDAYNQKRFTLAIAWWLLLNVHFDYYIVKWQSLVKFLRPLPNLWRHDGSCGLILAGSALGE